MRSTLLAVSIRGTFRTDREHHFSDYTHDIIDEVANSIATILIAFARPPR